MTREEAIAELKLFKGHTFIKTEEAINMAIKALEQEPCDDMTIAYLMGYYADKEPCDDVVSREAVIEIIRYSCLDLSNASATSMMIDNIRELPSVRPQEPKTGHWIRCDILQEFKCSECRVCFRHKTNYCPNCGAKMVEPQESEGE